MAAYKIAFRFNRDTYGDEVNWIAADHEIMRQIQHLLDQKQIKPNRIYELGRNSIKVIFPSEIQLNKVLEHREYFEENYYSPRISMALKASRTVFCSGFDLALLATYDTDQIKKELEKKKWGIENIYIMNNKVSFKIEFKTKHQATKYLDNTNTAIGGIKLAQDNKEREIDPTINQCWCCGILNPDHKSQNCLGTQICLKCGSLDHKFFNCDIPRTLQEMTQEHKDNRYCAACKKKGDHTTLDHAQCPTKKAMIQGWVREARTKRTEDNQAKQHDIDLIRNVIEFSNTEEWPTLQHNSQQTRVTTIVAMALLEEAVMPGSFQAKLTQNLANNGISDIKYTPHPETARAFFHAVCGAASAEQITPSISQQQPAQQKQQEQQAQQRQDTQTTQHTHFSRHSRDIMGGKKALKFNTDRETDNLPDNTGGVTLMHRGQADNTTHRSANTTHDEPKARLDKVRKQLQASPLLIVQNTAPWILIGGAPVKKFTVNQLMELLGTVTLNNTDKWMETIQDDILYLISKGFGDNYIIIKWELEPYPVHVAPMREHQH